MPSTIEVLKLAEQVIEDTIEELINTLCYEYTGLTLVEIYTMCNDGYRKYKEWKAIPITLKILVIHKEMNKIWKILI